MNTQPRKFYEADDIGGYCTHVHMESDCGNYPPSPQLPAEVDKMAQEEFEQLKKEFFNRWFPYLDTTEDGNRNIGGLDWRPNFKHQTEMLIGMAQKLALHSARV